MVELQPATELELCGGRINLAYYVQSFVGEVMWSGS